MIYIDNDTMKKLSLRTLSNYKKSVLCLALLLLLCGIFCLFVPVYAGVALSYVIGCLFIILGIYSLVSSAVFRKSSSSSFFSLLLFGIIYVFLGFSFVASPIVGINILSMLICILFILGGISRLTTAFKNPKMIGRYWCIFIGIIDFVIAFLWMSANEYTSYILTVMLIGLEMMLTAWFFFMLGYGINKFKRSFAGA